MYKYFIVIAFAILACTSNAQQTISLDAAKSMALSQNATYQAARAGVEATRWQKKNAFAAFLPNLSLGGTLLYTDPARSINTGGQSIALNKDQRSISLNLSQPLFTGGKLYQAYKMASLAATVAETGLMAEKLELVYDVENKYYSVLQLNKVYEIAQAELSQAESNLELAQIKIQNGLMARADLLRLQANLANKEIALLQTKTAYDLALRDFSNFLGSQELLNPLPVELDDSEILPFADFDEQKLERFSHSLKTIGITENLNLKQIQGGVELSQRAYKASKGSFLPTLTLVGSRSYDENGIDRYEFDASNQIMLNLSVPLLPQIGNLAASRKAYYEAQKTAMAAKDATDGILLATDSAALKLVSSARQVKNAKLSLDITEDMYAQISERFRLNMVSTVDLMDAELMLSAANMAYANAYYEFFKARLTLLNTIGKEDAAILTDILDR